MSRSVYINKGCLGEYHFRIPSLHDSVDNVVNSVIKVGAIHLDIFVKTVLFRKTDYTGTEVDTLVEVFELQTPTTGGVEFTSDFARDKDRENPTSHDLQFFIDDVGTPLVIDETGMERILSETGYAIKGAQERGDNVNIAYSLKPNTHYLIRSTVLNGPTDSSEDIIIGDATVIAEYKEG